MKQELQQIKEAAIHARLILEDNVQRNAFILPASRAALEKIREAEAALSKLIAGVDTENDTRCSDCPCRWGVHCSKNADRLLRLVESLVDNRPDDMAADGVTVYDVWLTEARKALGR